MSVAYVAEEITIIVLGRTSAITTGFASAIEAAGWRWEEIPDLPTLLARPLPTRAAVVVPLPAFTTTAYAMIRHLTSDRALPVVAFSAEYRPEVVNSILRAGADDFLALPVTVEEMVARLGAVMRVHFGAQDELHRSDYRLDEAAHLVTIGGGPPVRLSVGEYRLFRMLFAARNRPVARERLATIPLPHTDLDGQNALDATVSRLRRKVGADRIITIRGTGYQLVDNQPLPPNVSYMSEALGAR